MRGLGLSQTQLHMRFPLLPAVEGSTSQTRGLLRTRSIEVQSILQHFLQKLTFQMHFAINASFSFGKGSGGEVSASASAGL